jgi:6-phosphogluconolactonase
LRRRGATLGHDSGGRSNPERVASVVTLNVVATVLRLGCVLTFQDSVNLQITSDAHELALTAAERLLAGSQNAISAKGVFTIALSGGATPKQLYQLLADPNQPFRDQFPWDQTHFFWPDERQVGPDHPDSNYRMAKEAMLEHVPVPEANVHRMLGEKTNVQESVSEYEAQLRDFFKVNNSEFPSIDLVLLGLGTDGHTASIFPGSEVLLETRRLIAAPFVVKLNAYRLTMTLPVLNNAASIVFLVSGEEKARILRDVLQVSPPEFPAQAIKPTHRDLTWLVDSAAAKLLSG